MKKLLLTGAMLMALSFTAFAQDSCATATVIEATGGSYTVTDIAGEYYSSCFAAPDPDAEDPEPEADAAIWYAITAPSNGSYRINTNLAANEGGDTRVAVYSGTCGQLVCWSAADDVYFVSLTDNNTLTDFQFPVIGGRTYYIAFDNKWSNDGFDFEVSFLEPGCSSTEAINEDWSNSANYYFCWDKIDANGDENGWGLFDTFSFDSDPNPDPVVGIFAGEEDNEDLLISGEQRLAAGTEYTLNVTYNVLDGGANFPADESFAVAVFTLDPVDGYTLVETIGLEENLTQTSEGQLTLKDDAITGSYAFTPETEGLYHFGIVSLSPANAGGLFIFNVTLDGLLSAGSQTISNFAVYPNPTSNVVNVSANKALVSGVNFADLNGRVVKTAKFDGVAEAQVNISDLASGVYMMSISSDKGTTVKKIVKN